MFYENGNVEEDCYYVNGKKHGHYISKYQNNNVKEDCFYINGLKSGKYFSFYENRQPEQ